jgi:uncharacterized protein with von Willebrand factor type A (vWA) domain
MAPAPPTVSGSGLPTRIIDFVRALRGAGLGVAVSDGLDALRITGLIDLLDREQLRAALAATMIKSPGHRPAFDTLFDVYFPLRPDVGAESDDTERDVGDFLAELVERILAGDDDAITRMAREAVGSFGAVETRDGTTSWFQYRVFRSINTAGLLRRMIAEAGIDSDELADKLAREELERRLRRFRAEVESEVRRRLAAQRGTEHVARTLVRALPEEQDFFRVTADDEADMRRAVRPLARRLATRLAVKRRRARDGRLDVRRTLRRALSTGGVPIDPEFRAKRAHRPELVLVCDVSGSVSAFARFTLLFCHALQGQFSKVRSFAFIDTVDEVTDLFADGDVADGMRRLASEAKVVWLDGHSDYGNALTTMLERYPAAITPRSTVVILGDARNNYRATNAWALAEMQRRAKRVYWLNPEPAATWDTGDSVVSSYAPHTDATVECRNLRQLAEFIGSLARRPGTPWPEGRGHLGPKAGDTLARRPGTPWPEGGLHPASGAGSYTGGHGHHPPAHRDHGRHVRPVASRAPRHGRAGQSRPPAGRGRVHPCRSTVAEAGHGDPCG